MMRFWVKPIHRINTSKAAFTARRSPATANSVTQKPKNKTEVECEAANCAAANGADLVTCCRVLDIMNRECLPIDSDTYASLLQVCGTVKSLAWGREVHAHILISGTAQNVFVVTKLVSMYAKCGSLMDARLVFDKIPKRNVFLWNAVIRGYATNGVYDEVLVLYNQMQLAGEQPDGSTFPSVLKACAVLLALEQGKVTPRMGILTRP